ncbi:MAG: restriction endonuclease subunit S [Hyphomonadaceae bacterium]|nr:restriction endonuclease subunit S [Hyphomonadaceae bacterium]
MKNGDDRPEGPVPALRFPEFRDAPPWQVKRLGEVVEIIGGGTPDTSVPGYWNGGIQWFTPTEITAKYLSKSARTINQSGLEKSSAKMLPAGAILVTTRATIGNVGIALAECCTNQGFQSLVAGKNINNEFLYYSISVLNREFLRRASGSTFQEISRHEVSKIKIPLPSLPEQREIADCLQTWDEAIEKHGDEIKALTRQKRGLMQKLFPAPGETTPALRFPEFRDAPPWQVKRLGEVASIKMGQSPPSESYNDKSKGLPLIQGNADIEDRRTVPRRFTSSPTKTCEKGDILISVRAPIGEISRATVTACLGRGVGSIRPKSGDFEFWYQFLLHLEPVWHRIGQGSTFMAISSADIRKLSVRIPSLPEQREIADCLQTWDEALEKLKALREALKLQKRGLMQKLFPAPGGTA